MPLRSRDGELHQVRDVRLHEPLVVATFWAQALGSNVDEDSTQDRAWVEPAGWGGPTLWFVRVPEPKSAKNRQHFDLRPTSELAAEVRHLVALGQGCCETTENSSSWRTRRETSSVWSDYGRSPPLRIVERSSASGHARGTGGAAIPRREHAGPRRRGSRGDSGTRSARRA